MLENNFLREIQSININNHPILTVDIWVGISYQDKLKGLFSGDEYSYLTNPFTTVPEDLYSRFAHLFLCREDKNVERALKSYVPILHKGSLVSKKIRQQQQPIDEVLGEQPENVISVLIPVSHRVESRWKGVLWARFKKGSEINPATFVNINTPELLATADYLYACWRMSMGSNFSLYKNRTVFCDKAILVAKYLVDGYSARQISEACGLSHSGVEYHINSMKNALGAQNRANLIAELFRRGIVT